MVAIVSTCAYLGLEARGVEVQCQLAPGLPAFNVVGLADKAVGESRERVRAAIAAMGLALPPKRITVNLSPADLPKEGSHYDLPIAMALLAAMGVVDTETLAGFVVVGELGLDARIASSPGVLLAALHASTEDKGLICPAAQGAEAAWAGSVEVVAAPDLLALLNHLKGLQLLARPQPGEADDATFGPDLRQVIALVQLLHNAGGARSVNGWLGRGDAEWRAADADAALSQPASFRLDGGTCRWWPAREAG